MNTLHSDKVDIKLSGDQTILDMNALDDLEPPVIPFNALRCKSLDEVLALSHCIPSQDGSPSKKRRTGYADKDMRHVAFARVNARRGKLKSNQSLCEHSLTVAPLKHLSIRSMFRSLRSRRIKIAARSGLLQEGR